LGAYEEERAEPRIDVLEMISDHFNISLDDLLRRDLSDEKGGYLAKRRQQKLGAESHSVIHFVPMKAAAGYLAGYADEEFIDELNTFTLPMLGNGHFRAFEIIGDSMLPTPSGSIIVADDVLEIWQAQIVITKVAQQQRWDVGQLANLVSNLQEQVSSLKKRMN